MEEREKATYESQAQQLRIELKQWEVQWAKAHKGQKPAHKDIKQNPDIAAKYKQYNKVRDILAGKIAPPPSDEHQSKPRKRKSVEPAPEAHTTTKRSKTAETPSKAYGHPDVDALNSTTITPSISRKLFSPIVPTSIGPTPQRDGRVLGLFDLLAGTPCKSFSMADENDDPNRSKDAAIAVQATPSKRAGNALADLLSSGSGNDAHRRHNRTPMSGSKRAFLDSFMLTPRHRRDDSGTGGGVAKTPSSSTAAALLRSGGSVSKLQFATPAFLRRGNTLPLPALDENGEWKVSPLKLPRKLQPRRGLSTVVANLRRMEEEEAEEELDMLREMEREEELGGALGRPVRKELVTKNPVQQDNLDGNVPQRGQQSTEVSENVPPEVEGSQARQQELPVLLGGFDDEALLDSPDEDQHDRDGRLLRVFKKKGQKRTTRLVKMRPTRAKRPAQLADDRTGSDSEEEVVKVTQLDVTRPAREDPDDLLELPSGSDFEGSDADEDEDGGKKSKGKASAKKKDEKKEGPIKKAVRKIKATAHQNFKRLKLRNTGSKGGPGHNSRFRRKR